MFIWLTTLNKNGLESWPVYHVNDTDKRVFVSKDDGVDFVDSKGARFAANKVTETTVERYKVTAGGVDLIVEDSFDKSVLPPAGSLVLLSIERFYSSNSRREYFKLLGLGSPAVASALLGTMAIASPVSPPVPAAVSA